MGFGHRVYRAEDPRARVLRRTAKELGAPRYEVAAALEKAALDELHARRPDRVLATNVEFWAAIMLDFAEVPVAHVHLDVHLRADRRLGRAHPGAEAHRPAGPAERPLRRARRPVRFGCPRRRRGPRSWMSEPAKIVIPAELLPADGRFGSGPTKVRDAQVAALAAAGHSLLGTSHRQAPVRALVQRIRDGLATLFGLPDDYLVVLSNGGTTAFWESAAFGLISHKAQHLSFGEFSSKFAKVTKAAPWLDDPSVIASDPGTHRTLLRCRSGASATNRPMWRTPRACSPRRGDWRRRRSPT